MKKVIKMLLKTQTLQEAAANLVEYILPIDTYESIT